MEPVVLSEKIQEFNGVRYYLCGFYFQRKGERLHRTVWKYHKGEIPKGFHVHHKDGNRSNNSIDNLCLMEARTHESQHMSSADRKDQARKSIKHAIAAAPAWHRSQSGKEWHSTHAKETWGNMTPVERVCNFCGKSYMTMLRRKKGNHFCSDKCKAAYRRVAGVDNITKECIYCGKLFSSNKYAKQKYCSVECSRRNRWGDHHESC